MTLSLPRFRRLAYVSQVGPVLTFLSVFLMSTFIHGQVPPANEDESLVVMGQLPDPLAGRDGHLITDRTAWPKQREYLLELIGENEYGFAPSQPAKVAWKVVEQGWMFDGKTKRTQIVVTLSTEASELNIDFVLFSPTQLKTAKGCFLGLNFQGNHTVDKDPALRIPNSWVANSKETGITDNHATAQ
ncbi:MAG: hypothetical protein ACOVQM_06890, partial [Pirellula sp.]